MNDQPTISVKAMINNVVFYCVACKNYFNILEKQAYAVKRVMGVERAPGPEGKTQIIGDVVIICDDCWKDPKYKFSEPSPIIIPKVDEGKVQEALNKLNQK